ncbi:MAG: alpha-L-fucosidase [Thermoguttaceae bacterium]
MACFLKSGFASASLVVLLAVSGRAGEEIGDRGVGKLDLNKPEKLEWLQDAGFGMFIHWSVDSQLGSVISHSMVGASEDYLDWYVHELPKTFKPTRWDADEVARLAKLAGMQYVVFTTKHHNGFCWWDTKTTDFKSTNSLFGRAILQEYCEALRRWGLKVGFYYSPEDFNWLHSHGHPVCRSGPQLLDPDRDPEYGEFVRRQVTELFTEFGPIDVLFIDGVGAEITKKTCWELQPDCLITRGAIQTPEQHIPGVPPKGAWESCLTMGTQWAYKPTNDSCKSGTRILELLIETRAKGGALLLNVGPKPDGQLPIEQEALLREVALWHAVNGRAIHGTRPWVVSSEGDIWFTRQKDAPVVYAFLTGMPDWPRGERREFLLQSVEATAATAIRVVGHDGKIVEYSPDMDAGPRFRQTEEGLEISVVRGQRLYNDSKWPNPPVVKLENVRPAFETPPFAETGSARTGDPGRAVLEGNLATLGEAGEVTVGFEYQEF